MDGPDAGHHAVGGQIGRRSVGEEPVFDKVLATVVAKTGDAFAAEELPRGEVAVVILLRATLADLSASARMSSVLLIARTLQFFYAAVTCCMARICFSSSREIQSKS